MLPFLMISGTHFNDNQIQNQWYLVLILTDMWSYFDTDNGEWGDQSQPFKISRMYKESF